MCMENGKCKISDAKMNATRGYREQKYDCGTIANMKEENFRIFLNKLKKLNAV